MKSYRIGVDRLIAWHIVSDGVPYNLAGKDLTFKVSHPRGGFTVPSDGFTISGNVILWTFYGKDQKLLGPYSLTLIENEGQENMLSFDACNAFAFVSCTCQEGGIENPDLQLSGIDVETDLATIGIKLVVPVIGDNGNWFIGGVDTGHPVGGGSDCDCDLTEALSGKQDKIADLTDYSWAAVLAEAGKVSGKQDKIADLETIRSNAANAIAQLQTILGPDATPAIDRFNEIISFLEGIEEGDEGKLAAIIASIEQQISGKQDKISNLTQTSWDAVLTEAGKVSGKQDKIADLETIRSNAANAIAQLQTILGPDATPAIDRFNEIISFLEGIEEGDEGKLAAIIASIEQQISGKQDKISNLTQTSWDAVLTEAGKVSVKQDAIVGLNQRNWDDTASKAASALQSETYKGTVTGVKMNGATKNPSNGVVDLGTVITEFPNMAINYGPSMSEWEPVPFTGDVTIRPYEFLIYDSAPSNYMTWSSQKIKSELDKKAALDSSPTFTGEVFAPSFQESSDETLKDFGEDIKIDFDKLKALPKKYFTWKSGGEKQIGTSAQEVKKLFPEIVGKRKDGTLTVDYGRLTMPALAAIDELYTENQELKRREIEHYEKTKALEERISRLEALILK